MPNQKSIRELNLPYGFAPVKGLPLGVEGGGNARIDLDPKSRRNKQEWLVPPTGVSNPDCFPESQKGMV